MRLTTLLLLLITTTSFGQAPYLERKITISFEKEPIESSLNKISEAGGFVFSYNPDILEQRKTVTQKFTNRSVREVLDEIFQGTVQYKARGKHIILTAAPRSSKSVPAVVSGYVVDESTGERLKDVSIYDPVTLTSVTTDSYGYFEIKIDRAPSDIILSVNRQNYTDTLIAVTDRNRLVKIPIKLNQVRIDTDKFAVLADSVNQKLKRAWRWSSDWFNDNINLRNIDDSLYRPFQVSFVPFVGTNHKMSAHVINDFSLNIIGGYALGVRKAEVGGVFNLVRGHVTGFQAAGVYNRVGGNVTGAQVAGVFNENAGRTDGFQAAGVMNINTGDAAGFSVAGVGNIAAGQTAPAQVAGVFNIAGGKESPSPMQIGGVLNIAAADVKGLQIGGVFNIAGRQVGGAQIAGVFNVAGTEVNGTQISGVINIAPKVRGNQIGLINIADSVKGIPVGLMSLVAKGYHKIEISVDEVFYNNIAFRTGVRHFYNILHVGAKPSTYGEENTVWTFGYGIGASAKIARKLYMDFDLTSNQIVNGGTIEALHLLNKAYLGFEFQVLKKMSINAGATLNGLVTETDYDAYPTLFTGYQPDIIVDRKVGRHHNLKMWMGAKVGIRFF